MKIMVPIKRVIDYRVKVRLKSDNSAVQTDGVKHSMNPFDEIALEQAIQCVESGHATDILVLSVGPDPVQETLRTALAMGATRALHIQTDSTIDAFVIAQILAEIVKKEFIDLVLCGKQAIDDDRHQVPQMLAAFLDCPQATCVSSMRFEQEVVEVVRETDHGLETLMLPLPAVMSCDLRLNKPRFVTLPNIMKAKTKVIKRLGLEDLSVSNIQRCEVMQLDTPLNRKRGVMVDSLQDILSMLDKKELA